MPSAKDRLFSVNVCSGKYSCHSSLEEIDCYLFFCIFCCFEDCIFEKYLTSL